MANNDDMNNETINIPYTAVRRLERELIEAKGDGDTQRFAKGEKWVTTKDGMRYEMIGITPDGLHIVCKLPGIDTTPPPPPPPPCRHEWEEIALDQVSCKHCGEVLGVKALIERLNDLE